MNRKFWVYLGLITVSAIWGVNFGISRFAMSAFDPVLFSFLRFSLSVPILFLILKVKEDTVGVTFRDLGKLLLIGLIGVTTLEIAVMYSIKYTTLANSSLLNVTPWPIFAALFAPFFTKEKLTSRLLTGGGIAMIGVCMIILGGGQAIDLSSRHLFGDLLAFGVSIIGALFNVACMPLMQKYSPLRVSTWYILFGAIFMFPFTLHSWSKVSWTSLGLTGWSAIFFNVVLCTVLAFVVWNWAMQQAGAARANFFRYVVPAAAVITGYLMFHETLAIWQLFGGALMVLGLIWISFDKPPVIEKAAA